MACELFLAYRPQAKTRVSIEQVNGIIGGYLSQGARCFKLLLLSLECACAADQIFGHRIEEPVAMRANVESVQTDSNLILRIGHKSGHKLTGKPAAIPVLGRPLGVVL